MRTTSLALSPAPGATPGGQVCGEDGANVRVGWGLSKLVLTLVACCVLFQIPAEAQVREIRRVLIINALGPSYPSTALIEEAIRTVLEKSPYQIELYHEYLETVLFPDPSTQQKFGESYIQKYRDRKPDVIIADGLSSIRLMNASHEKFFPDTPTVFCGAIEQFANDLELDPQFVGVWMVPQPAKTLGVALQLLPGTKHVVVVSGTGKMDRLGEALVREQLRSYEARLEFTHFTDLRMPELLERLKRLPSDTIVFYSSFSQDAAGTRFIDATQSTPMVAAAANAPVFVMLDTFVGHGTVGGYVSSYAAQGQAAAAIVLRLLNGEKPQDIPVVSDTNRYMFDWRALRRWGINEKHLPPGSTVLYRVPTYWERYRRQVEIALLFLLGLLFLGSYLFLERRRRKGAEESLVRQLRFETLISEISSEFIDLPSAQIESGIQKSLVRVRDFLGADRVSIFELAGAGTSLRLRHSARVEGIAAAPKVLSRADYPWLFSQLHGTEPIVLSRLADLPSDAKGERELFREINPGALMIFPLTVQNCLVGILSFVVIQAVGSWPTDLRPQLKAVSQAYANAFTRELAKKALFESEERFRLVADTTPLLIWMSGTDKLFNFFNQGWLNFTGRAIELELGQGWASGVHPEDLQRCLDLYSASFDARVEFEMEYRLRRFDGEYRWIAEYGVPRFGSDGSFCGYIGSCIDITERKLATQSLQALSGRLIQAQEEERARIARELHDDFSQSLALQCIDLEQLLKRLPESDVEGRVRLLKMLKDTKAMSKDLRSLSHQLHSSKLEFVGLVPALRGFCEEIAEKYKIEVDFTERGSPLNIPKDVALCLFRVTQEALGNVVKHSQAKSAHVELGANSNGLSLRISDDGRGFDSDHTKPGGGLGLVGMTERLRLVSGRLLIRSELMRGTEILAEVPLPVLPNEERARTVAAGGTES